MTIQLTTIFKYKIYITLLLPPSIIFSSTMSYDLYFFFFGGGGPILEFDVVKLGSVGVQLSSGSSIWKAINIKWYYRGYLRNNIPLVQ